MRHLLSAADLDRAQAVTVLDVAEQMAAASTELSATASGLSESAGMAVAEADVAGATVRGDDTPDTLAARVLKQEHIVYPHALRLVAGGHVRVEGERAIVSAPFEPPQTLISPPLLTTT